MNFASVVPILPVSDMKQAVINYERLGFKVTAYETGDYAFALRDEAAIHLAKVAETDPVHSQVAVYLYVDNADNLAEEWKHVPGELVRPADTVYGLREGAYIDPDGNLIRYGSKLKS